MDPLEGVAQTAQKYIAPVPTLIVGSGASAPFDIPGMGDFANVLLDRVRAGPGEEATAWEELKAPLAKHRNLELSLSEVDLPKSLVEKITVCAWELFTEKDGNVLDRLLTERLELPLTRLLRYLLRTANRRPTVVTTNYERLIEYSANMASAVAFTGFTPGWIQKRWPAIPFEAPRAVDIWKVHGSLDWFRGPAGEVLSVPRLSSIPAGHQPLIVTPGTSKYQETHQEPLRTVMTRADEALRRARSFLVVGYGFNDDHVQPVLIDRVRSDSVPIVVLARTLSTAARQLLLDPAPAHLLALEKTDGGTIAYTSESPEGDLLAGVDLWSLDKFMTEIVEPRETIWPS